MLMRACGDDVAMLICSTSRSKGVQNRHCLRKRLQVLPKSDYIKCLIASYAVLHNVFTKFQNLKGQKVNVGAKKNNGK